MALRASDALPGQYSWVLFILLIVLLSATLVSATNNGSASKTVSSRWCLENATWECLQRRFARRGLPPQRAPKQCTFNGAWRILWGRVSRQSLLVMVKKHMETLGELGSYILMDAPGPWQFKAPAPRPTIKQVKEARKGNRSLRNGNEAPLTEWETDGPFDYRQCLCLQRCPLRL